MAAVRRGELPEVSDRPPNGSSSGGSASSGAPPAAHDKPTLRREARRRLSGLAPADRERWTAAAVERLLALPEVAAARRVMSCLSFGDELDTWGLIARLGADPGRELLVPRSDFPTRLLTLHRYPCRLVTLPMGLAQPSAAEPVVVEPPDVAVVLGLAFDRRRGYRLGHGAGFFDRFLAAAPFTAVGLAFEAQLVDELPVEPHDVPMDVVVTEEGVYRH